MEKESAGATAATNGDVRIPPLLVSSYSKKATFIVVDGKVVWEYQTGKVCHDSWALPNGNILIPSVDRVIEVARSDKTIVWKYEPPEGIPVEIHSCQPLQNGNVLIGESGPNRLIEVDRSGTIRKEVKVTLNGGAHLSMLIVRKTKDNVYLVCCPHETAVYVFDENGKVRRKITPNETVGHPEIKWQMVHSVRPLANGNLLISTSYGGSFFEIDPENKIVWTLTSHDISEIGLKYASGCQRLANGNLVVSGYDSAYPIFEITPDKKVVWKYQNPEIGFPTDVKVIENAVDVKMLDIVQPGQTEGGGK